MRLTIERLRTIVLLAGVVLVVVLGVFLGLHKLKNPVNRKDLPHRLGFNVQQEANGFTFSHALGAHAQYEIHASKVIQLKQGNRLLLHDVKIKLYGDDGKQFDRIEGGEFEYDQQAGLAKAAGPVQITLSHLDVAPSVAPKARTLADKAKQNALTAAAANSAKGEIDVRTSGLVFNQNTGVASTEAQVQFSTLQGSGSAVGASYDSKAGYLVLEHAVQMNTHRGNQPVEIHAQRADLKRDDELCHLDGASASYPGGEAQAGDAIVSFRRDGSAQRLDAKGGLILTTKAGGRLASPTGWLEFDAHNQPTQAWLQDGVTIDSSDEHRKLHGTSPTLALKFTGNGLLQSAHLERGVEIDSDESTLSDGVAGHSRRSWTSPVADLTFRSERGRKVELASMHGTQGVKIAAQDQHGTGAAVPSMMAADDVTGSFGPNSVLTDLVGAGHARMEQTAADGTRQDVSGEHLVAHFANADVESKPAKKGNRSFAFQVQSAIVDGNVVLTQQPAAKPGAPTPPMLRATADRALDEGGGEWLRLTGSPRVTDGGLELTAEKIDVSQTSGTALATGNVKATWFGNEEVPSSKAGTAAAGAKPVPTLGGRGPSHVIAATAELHQKTGEATFQGHARLWQQSNSIAAPTIILNRTAQTLAARTSDAAEPVRVVLLRQDNPAPGTAKKSNSPSVVRLKGGDLKYSSAERKAVMKSGIENSVVTETNDSTMESSEMDLLLAPPGNHAGKDGSEAQVQSLTAVGHVVVESQNRKGTGEKLVYLGETGEYTLTGTAGAPPRMMDPARGAVTGEALIFNGRDDSVRVEQGGGNSTVSNARKQQESNR